MKIKNNSFILVLTVGEKCNFKCEYCNANKNNQILNYENFKKFIYLFDKKLINYNKSMHIMGGESYLNLDMESFLKDFPNWKIVFLTNLSMSISYLNKIIKYNNLELYISLHFHQINNLDEYINKIIFLFKNNVKMRVRILLEKNQQEKILYSFNKLKSYISKNFILEFKLLFPLEKYSDINLYNQLLQKYDEKFFYDYYMIDNKKILYKFAKNLKIKNLLCVAGRNSLSINYNGDIYYCDTFRVLYPNKKIGNINNKNIIDIINNIPLKYGIFCQSKCICEKYLSKFTNFKKFRNFLTIY